MDLPPAPLNAEKVGLVYLHKQHNILEGTRMTVTSTILANQMVYFHFLLY